MAERSKKEGLVLDDIKVAVDARDIVGPISITIDRGEIAALMGPSGSGKSTLLGCICGTLGAGFTSSGKIVLNGRELNEIPAEERRIGILFQDDLLFPHMSVGDNLAFGLPPSFRGRGKRLARVKKALTEAGLDGFEGRHPASLSGGQRARVGLMRVLLSEPEALLLDEPFGALDFAARRRFREMVFEHARRRGLPTLLVTHDREDAAATGGRIIELANKETGLNEG